LVMPRKITVRAKIAALLASDNVGSHALILDDQDVVLLLRAAIELEGNQVAFVKRHGLERTHLNAILNGRRLASGSSRIMNVLGLRRVYVLHRNNRQ
jgi:hypothetical protein